MQVEALNEMDTQLLHRLVFLRSLDALGDHHRILVVAEADHFFDETLLDEIHVDAVDQRDIELDEVGLEVGD